MIRHIPPFAAAVVVGVILCALAAPAQADLVKVTATGVVTETPNATGALAAVAVDDPVTIMFILDSNVFTNSGSFPTRGYVIDPSSFSVTVGSVTLGMQSPFPVGETPYFVLRNNDPAVDGFFMSQDVDFPSPLVPLDEAADFGQYAANLQVTYSATTTLTSLNILDAVGIYGTGGVATSNLNIVDGNASTGVAVAFEQLTIAVVPEPASAAVLAIGVLAMFRRNRTSKETP